jgi:rare lipoprotein A
MIRRNAVSLCVLGLVATDALLIGAVNMRPATPMSNAIVALPPALSVSPRAVSAASTANAVSAAKKLKEKQIGVASWYGDHWQGRAMASGKPFDDSKLTAAHRTLPLNTRVRVTNLETGRSVEVTITDRGPYVDGRVIDLSVAAAQRLGMVREGLVPVQITTIAPEGIAAPEATTKVASLDVR